MQYPRILKSPNLTRVFGSWDGDAQSWQKRVNEVFGMAIALNVERAGTTSLLTCSIDPLEWQVLEELSNILRSSRTNWKYWTVELVEKTIPKLVKACIWKNSILSEQSYLRDVVNAHAAEGVELLSGLSDYFTLYSKDPKPSTRKHLVSKYLEAPYTEGDSKAVLLRALRCFVTLRISRKPKSDLIFKFTPDLRISLLGKTFDKYLYEQLCLFVYLFRNSEEAHFFLERRQQLINFVSSRLPDRHEDLAESIVGETFEYLIRRRDTYCQSPDQIWIDTSLDTFFIGNILSSKRIQRFWDKKRRMEGGTTPERDFSDEDLLMDDVTARPRKKEPVDDYYYASASTGERDRLLREYIDKLDPLCRSYLLSEFFGLDLPQNGQLDTKHFSAIEKPCLKKIRSLLVSNGYYDLFIK